MSTLHPDPPAFRAALRMLVGFVVTTAPYRVAVLLLLAVGTGLLGPVAIAATGLVLARAPAAVGTGLGSPAGGDLLLAVGLLGLAFAAAQALTPVRDALGNSIGSAVVQRQRERFLRATLAPAGIAHLEDAEVADEIKRAGDIDWDIGPMTMVVQEMGRAASQLAAASGAALLLARFDWWAPVVLVASALLTIRLMHRDEYQEIQQREEYAAKDRRGDYLLDLALDPPAAKETRLFGLAPFLAGRTGMLREEFYSHVWRARRAGRVPVILTVSTIAVTHGVVLAALGVRVLDGTVAAADLIVYVQAIAALAALGHGFLDLWWVYQGAAALPHLLRLEERTGAAAGVIPTGTRSAGGRPSSQVRLAGLRFGYPGAARPVLDGVDLTIPAGSSLALVGANGAGKTTLLKLLARLYDPVDGAILIDGVDLREYDLTSWRRQLAVIFADFVRYELSARENVGYGRPGELADEEALRKAASRADALSLVDGLPHGWDTVLARQYRGGAELSGGQWQRIALARALRAAEGGARLLVLDEPTANLDVGAEAALFDRFLELTAGTTTLLVTHRLSTVRHADRIAVLLDGRVAEQGTHEELLAADGSYARMFRLQASRFRTGAGHG